MKCPVCSEELKFHYEDSSYRDDGKEYERKYYNCKKDDVWIMVETPKDKIANLA